MSLFGYSGLEPIIDAFTRRVQSEAWPWPEVELARLRQENAELRAELDRLKPREIMRRVTLTRPNR